jgi:hypothetical protein
MAIKARLLLSGFDSLDRLYGGFRLLDIGV